METLLIEQWLGSLPAHDMLDEASLTLVRDRIRSLTAPPPIIDRALLVASELGWNQLKHARRGHIAAREIARGSAIGIEIVAADAGLGIEDLDHALDAPLRAQGSLGVGVGAVRRLATEVDFDVRLGEGTCVRARIFEEGTPRGVEVGVYGRALPGEETSGDHAAFEHRDDGLRAIVCDGLGHGHGARVASDAAVGTFLEHVDDLPERVIAECHHRLAGTRGVVMAAVRLDPGTVEVAAAGNVEVQLVAFRQSRRFGGKSATVGGGRGGPLVVRSEQAPIEEGDVVMMTTDGIVSRASIEDDGALLRAHPAIIAQRILERFARSHDDALVFVAR